MNSKNIIDLSQSINEIVLNAEATQGKAFAEMLKFELYTAQLVRFVRIMIDAAQAGELDEVYEDMLIDCCVDVQAEQFELMSKHVGFTGDVKAVCDLAQSIVERIEQAEAQS